MASGRLASRVNGAICVYGDDDVQPLPSGANALLTRLACRAFPALSLSLLLSPSRLPAPLLQDARRVLSPLKPDRPPAILLPLLSASKRERQKMRQTRTARSRYPWPRSPRMDFLSIGGEGERERESEPSNKRVGNLVRCLLFEVDGRA